MELRKDTEEKEQFFKETNGQYSLFDLLPSKERKKDKISQFIQEKQEEVQKLIGSKEEYQKYEALDLDNKDKMRYILSTYNLFSHFIKNYFLEFSQFEYEEVMKKYENYSHYYHLLCKMFLFYLSEFVYNSKKEHIFDENLVYQMERFIEADTVKHRDPYYVSILKNELQEHKKIRVNNYILCHLEPFLSQIKQIACQFVNLEELDAGKKKELGNQIYEEIKKIQEDFLLQTTIFKQSNVITENNQDILVVLFLKYLEYCVYFDSFEYPSAFYQQFNAKIEDYVIFYFHDTIALSTKEEKVYSIIMEQVAERFSIYVKKVAKNLFDVLKEQDKLSSFIHSSKYKVIALQETRDDLPNIYQDSEIKNQLKKFLEKVFMFSSKVSKNRMPLFLDSFEITRNMVLKLGLEYLSRYVYSVSEEEGFEDDFIVHLENLLVSCDFKVKESELCLAKSILYKRVNVRNVIQNPVLRRKVLKSRKV